MASTVNPFSIGVASGEVGVSIGDGIALRVVLWVVLTAISTAYAVRYAQRVRSDPSRSLTGFDPAAVDVFVLSAVLIGFISRMLAVSVVVIPLVWPFTP